MSDLKKQIIDIVDKTALEKSLTDLFKNAPHLPEDISKFLADIAYLIIILLIVADLVTLPSILVGSIFSTYMFFHFILVVIEIIIALASYEDIKNKTVNGWKFLLAFNILFAISTIFSIMFGFTYNVFGSLFAIMLDLYVLMEVKPFYKK